MHTKGASKRLQSFNQARRHMISSFQADKRNKADGQTTNVQGTIHPQQVITGPFM
jgi:hypothetical protein